VYSVLVAANLVVSISAIDCLDSRLVSQMACYTCIEWEIEVSSVEYGVPIALAAEKLTNLCILVLLFFLLECDYATFRSLLSQIRLSSV